MKNFVFTLVMLFVSFIGFSQEDTSVIDFSKISAELFAICDDSTIEKTKDFFIPISSDNDGIIFFNDAISETFSIGKYQASVFSLDNTTKFVSNVLVEIYDGKSLIVVSLCSINKVYNKGILLTEYYKVFGYINDNFDKIMGYE